MEDIRKRFTAPDETGDGTVRSPSSSPSCGNPATRSADDHLLQTADGVPVEMIIVGGSPDEESIRPFPRGRDPACRTGWTGPADERGSGGGRGAHLLSSMPTPPSSGAFRRIEQTLSQGDCVAGAFDLRYNSRAVDAAHRRVAA